MWGGVPSVLFVSRSNAVRSLLAESCLRSLGGGKFQAFSCGRPGDIPAAAPAAVLLALQRAGLPTDNLTPKPWSEFARFGPSRMDYLITLDRSVLDTQPVWPGQPERALWDYPRVEVDGLGSESGAALSRTLLSLHRRLELLVSLHSKVRSHRDLREDLRDIGRN